MYTANCSCIGPWREWTTPGPTHAAATLLAQVPSAAASGAVAPLIAGHALRFTVTTRDRYENVRRVGGDDVRLLIRTPLRVLAAQVTDHGDGTYDCAALPLEAGELLVTLSVNRIAVPLDASPVSVPSFYHLPRSTALHLQLHPAAPASLSLDVVNAPRPLSGTPLGTGTAATRTSPHTPVVIPLGVGFQVRVTALDEYGNVCDAFAALDAEASYELPPIEVTTEVAPLAVSSAEDAFLVPLAATALFPPTHGKGACAEVRVAAPPHEGLLCVRVCCGDTCEAMCSLQVVDPAAGFLASGP